MRKTLNQLISDGVYTIPSYIDPATASLITQWFGDRETIKNFPVFFNRELGLSYPYYKQMLRIDCTVAEYDWFVTQYREHENILNETASKEKTTGQTISGEITNTNTKTVGITGNSTTVFAGAGSVNTTGSGTTSDTLSASRGTEASNEVNTSGTDETEYDTTVKDDTKNENNTRNTGFSRNAPMSTDINTLRTGGTINGGSGYSVPDHVGGIAFPNITNPTVSSDALVENAGITCATNAKTGTDTVTKSGTETSSYDETVTSSETKSGQTTKTDETNTTDNSNTQVTNTNSEQTTGNGTLAEEKTIDGTVSENNGVDRVSHEILTGRDGSIPDLLEKSMAAIGGSMSWLWLAGRLEKSFYQLWGMED